MGGDARRALARQAALEEAVRRRSLTASGGRERNGGLSLGRAALRAALGEAMLLELFEHEGGLHGVVLPGAQVPGGRAGGRAGASAGACSGGAAPGDGRWAGTGRTVGALVRTVGALARPPETGVSGRAGSGSPTDGRRGRAGGASPGAVAGSGWRRIQMVRPTAARSRPKVRAVSSPSRPALPEPAGSPVSDAAACPSPTRVMNASPTFPVLAGRNARLVGKSVELV
jgi:hypothetical protein